MPYFLAPDPAQSTFLVPGTNTPGDGVLLFTYDAGTTTKVTVYKDDAGGSSHTNPIVLDSGGNLPSASVIWLLGGQSYKFVWAPSNDTDPPASPYRTIDNVDGINDVGIAQSLQWISGPTPTYVGATQLTLLGDQTSNAHVGRRIQTTNTGGTIYSTITSSVFSASTTAIGTRNDSGSLDAGLSALNYGLLTKLNPSIPEISDFYPLRSSSSDASKTFRAELGPLASSTDAVMTLPQYSFRPATQNIASTTGATASTNVSTANGDYGIITGTSVIRQFTMYPGQVFTAEFASTCTLSTDAALFPGIPGNMNVSTRAGDILLLRGTSSNVGRVVTYQPAQTAPYNFGEVFLAAGTALNTTVLNIPYSSEPYTLYRNKRLELTAAIPASDGTALLLSLSSSGGASFFSGASQYATEFFVIDNTGANGTTAIASTNAQLTNVFVGNGSNEGCSASLRMYGTNNSALWQHTMFQTAYVDSNATPRSATTIGNTTLASSAVNNAAQLRFNSGNISSATWTLFGSN